MSGWIKTELSHRAAGEIERRAIPVDDIELSGIGQRNDYKN